MKSFVFFILLVFVFTLLSADTTVPAGPVSGNWTFAGSPYQIMGNINIASGDVLTIGPGVDVIFNGIYKLEVSGQIVCNGESDNIITFTAADTLAGWSSIRLSNTGSGINLPSEFHYTNFSYAKAVNGTTGMDPLNFGGAVWADNAGTLTFDNCRFTRCKSIQDGSAIYAKNGTNVTMTDCTIKSCESGFFGGVYVDDGAAEFVRCSFINNSAQTFGAAIYLLQCNPANVTSCIIAQNVAGAVTGIYSSSSPLIITNSLFSENTATLGSGAGIGIVFGTLEVINCTFADNTAAGSGGAVWLNNLDSAANIVNSIFWDNAPNQIETISSMYNFSYCSLQLQDGDITNIVGNPLFTDESNGDFTLSVMSPCIDMGTPDTSTLNLPLTDLAGLPRIVDGDANSIATIDIGCYERPEPIFYGNIIGTVYDDQNTPLEGAVVSVDSLDTVTDEDGGYEFVLLPGIYSVTCTMTGYIPVTVDNIEVFAWQITEVDFTLNPVANSDQYIQPTIISLINYPNPFVQSTAIAFSLSKKSEIKLSIYNLKGQKIKTLFNDTAKSGNHTVNWNGTDEQNRLVGKGIYLYKLEIDSKSLRKKMIKM